MKTVNKKNIRRGNKSYKLAESWQKHEGNSDVLGSWTGTPEDGEIPVQDADDL